MFWFLLLIPPPVVLVSPIHRPQGVALVHGRLVRCLHLKEPGDCRKAEAQLLEQGLVVGQTKLEGRPVERIQAGVGRRGDRVVASRVCLLPSDQKRGRMKVCLAFPSPEIDSEL